MTDFLYNLCTALSSAAVAVVKGFLEIAKAFIEAAASVVRDLIAAVTNGLSGTELFQLHLLDLRGDLNTNFKTAKVSAKIDVSIFGSRHKWSAEVDVYNVAEVLWAEVKKVGAAITNLVQSAKAKFDEIKNAISDAVQDAVDSIKGFVNDAINFVKEKWENVKTWTKNAAASGVAWAKNAVDAAGSWVQGAGQTIGNAAKDVGNAVNNHVVQPVAQAATAVFNFFFGLELAAKVATLSAGQLSRYHDCLTSEETSLLAVLQSKVHEVGLHNRTTFVSASEKEVNLAHNMVRKYWIVKKGAPSFLFVQNYDPNEELEGLPHQMAHATARATRTESVTAFLESEQSDDQEEFFDAEHHELYAQSEEAFGTQAAFGAASTIDEDDFAETSEADSNVRAHVAKLSVN